jgi:hypothetical protein
MDDPRAPAIEGRRRAANRNQPAPGRRSGQRAEVNPSRLSAVIDAR